MADKSDLGAIPEDIFHAFVVAAIKKLRLETIETKSSLRPLKRHYKTLLVFA
jgi:hypothetical protein